MCIRDRFFNQRIYLVLPVNAILAPGRAVGDADAHAHGADVVPATDLFGRFLRFEIEINDILQQPCGHWANDLAKAQQRRKNDSEILLHSRSQTVHRSVQGWTELTGFTEFNLREEFEGRTPRHVPLCVSYTHLRAHETP